MRVGVLTQWYSPEPGPASLPAVLARELLDRGHTVQVVTGFPNYPTGVLATGYRMQRRMDDEIDGVPVRRVALYPSHDSSALARATNYGSFGASAVISGVNALRGFDALWVNASPITVAWPMWAAHFGLKLPSVVHVLDLWPDTLLASGFAHSGPLFSVSQKLLNIWSNSMYRTAHSVAYISPSVGEILSHRGVSPQKLEYVPMWANERVFKPSAHDLRSELGLAPDALVLLYAGALGEVQGLSTLIEACSEISDRRFVCLVAGSGLSEVALRRQASDSGITCVRFLGRVPQEKMTALMATSDISYISLRPHALSRVSIPSKIQASLASGRALIVAGEGDMAEVARQSGAGWAVNSGDVTAIRSAIRAACDLGRDGLHLKGTKAKLFYDRTFSVNQGVDKLELMLHSASESKRGGKRTWR